MGLFAHVVPLAVCWDWPPLQDDAAYVRRVSLSLWLLTCFGFMILYAVGIPDKWPYPVSPLTFLGTAIMTTPVSSLVLRRRLSQLVDDLR